MEAMPWLAMAIGWSNLMGAVVLGACLAWLGTGRSIPLVSILVAGSVPWLTAIGVGLGSRTVLMSEHGSDLKGEQGYTLTLVLSGQLQSYLLTALLCAISLQTAAMLVLWVEASLEHRGSGPAQHRPGRWSSRTAAALATATLGFCLLAVLHTWTALYPISLRESRGLRDAATRSLRNMPFAYAARGRLTAPTPGECTCSEKSPPTPLVSVTSARSSLRPTTTRWMPTTT